MHIKSDTEYIAKTGHTIDADGNIPLEMKAELVRCKECMHHGDAYNGSKKHISTSEVYCTRYELRNPNSWFCADGERKK